MAAALEVVVAQKGAPDDGQIGIGSDEPPRVGVREIEQPRDGAVAHGHGAMHTGRHDEVLGKVAVRREPPGPGLAAELHLGDGRARSPQMRRDVLPRRLPAQVAGSDIAAICSGDIPRILLGLGQVDGDLQGPCRRIVRPERIAALVHGLFPTPREPAHGSRLANTPGPPTTTSRQAR